MFAYIQNLRQVTKPLLYIATWGHISSLLHISYVSVPPPGAMQYCLRLLRAQYPFALIYLQIFL